MRVTLRDTGVYIHTETVLRVSACSIVLDEAAAFLVAVYTLHGPTYRLLGLARSCHVRRASLIYMVMNRYIRATTASH